MKPLFFSEKWNPEEIREVQEEVKMAVGKKKAIRDFTQGNPTKELLMFSLPIACTLILQSFYNMADTLIVGNFVGDTAMGAVGTAGTVSGVLLMLVYGLSTGMGVVVSQFIGAKDYKNVKKSMMTAMYIVIGVSLLMTVIGISFSQAILRMMHVEGETLEMAVVYLRIIFAGTIAVAFYNMGNVLSRSLGDSVTPMIVLIITAVMNIALNILFVTVFHMKTDGVAYATVLANIISAISCWTILWRKTEAIHPDAEALKPDKEAAKLILKIGIPATLQNSTMTIGALLIQTMINDFTTPTLPIMAAFAAATKVEQLIAYPPGGVSDGMQTFAGQNVGAGKFDRVGKGLTSCFKIIAVYSIFSACVLGFGGRFLMGLFTSTEATIMIGSYYLIATAIGIFFNGIDYTFRFTLTGAGDATASTVLSVIGLVMRVGIAYVLAYFTPLGYIGIFIGTPASWALNSIFGMIRYKSGKWKEKCLIKQCEVVEG